MLADYQAQGEAAPKKVFEALVEGPARTGKTRGLLHLIDALCRSIPGLRVLIVRETRASLTNSALQTFEDEVLQPGDPILEGPTREHRTRYDYENGSVIELGGLDNASRLYSTTYDIVYIVEVFEVSLDSWEKFLRPLSRFHGGLRWQLLLGDTNPDAETHWANMRCKEGVCLRYTSTLRDNPKYWDRADEAWTEDGAAYRESLERLSGVRRSRLLDGKWCTAEGAVWETFDASIHIIDRPSNLKRDLGITRFVGAVDWGHADPGVLQIWGLDNFQRAYRVAEWYSTNTGQAEWAERAAIAYQEFQPLKAIVCDPADSQGGREAINLRLSKMGSARPLAIKGDNARHGQGKGDIVGLDLVREKLRPQSDGNPALFFVRGSSRCRDDWLHLNKEPTCTEQEIPGYVYLVDETGKPSKERTDPTCPDHGCDATRYAMNFIWRHLFDNKPELLRPKVGSIASAMSRRNPEAVREWLEIDALRVKAAEREKAGMCG
jgi:phage terminase large subunit